MKHYKITLARSKISFYYNNSISLLTAIEQNGVRPDYGCRDGFCGTCSCIVLEGKWHYDGVPIAFCRPNSILLCCCIVDSDLVLDI